MVPGIRNQLSWPSLDSPLYIEGEDRNTASGYPSSKPGCHCNGSSVKREESRHNPSWRDASCSCLQVPMIATCSRSREKIVWQRGVGSSESSVNCLKKIWKGKVDFKGLQNIHKSCSSTSAGAQLDNLRASHESYFNIGLQRTLPVSSKLPFLTRSWLFDPVSD